MRIVGRASLPSVIDYRIVCIVPLKRRELFWLGPNTQKYSIELRLGTHPSISMTKKTNDTKKLSDTSAFFVVSLGLRSIVYTFTYIVGTMRGNRPNIFPENRSMRLRLLRAVAYVSKIPVTVTRQAWFFGGSLKKNGRRRPWEVRKKPAAVTAARPAERSDLESADCLVSRE